MGANHRWWQVQRVNIQPKYMGRTEIVVSMAERGFLVRFQRWYKQRSWRIPLYVVSSAIPFRIVTFFIIWSSTTTSTIHCMRIVTHHHHLVLVVTWGPIGGRSHYQRFTPVPPIPDRKQRPCSQFNMPSPPLAGNPTISPQISSPLPVSINSRVAVIVLCPDAPNNGF